MSFEQIAEVRAKCAEVYTPEGVDIWMSARQRYFYGRTALEMIEAGEADVVMYRLEQLIRGAW
jgi:hypothetical protein